MSPVKALVLFPIHFSNSAIAHVLYSLCSQWQGPELTAQIIVQSCEPEWREAVIAAISPMWSWWHYRFSNPGQMAEQLFLKELCKFDVAYLYPGVSLDTLKKVQHANKPIFLERVNTYQGHAKQVLDDAYSKLGLQPSHNITEEDVQEEAIEVSLADFLFCPSQAVADSYRAIGIPDYKLITVSEGWDPNRFSQASPNKNPSEDVTILFLGSVCVRKGAHLLLRAWERSGIKGRLILKGRMEPAIAKACSQQLSRQDVTYIPFSSDYTSIYRQADIFVLPSLEEGSPLVVYEAMGNGLPILASPMGGGGIVRDQQDGLISSPYDEDLWIENLRFLAKNPDLRQQMGASARNQANEYTWEKVAKRRAELMLAKIVTAQL